MALVAQLPKPRPNVPKVVKLAAPLTPWVSVKMFTWAVAALLAVVSVLLLSLIGGILSGILTGIGKVGSELTLSAVRDLRFLWRNWVERG